MLTGRAGIRRGIRALPHCGVGKWLSHLAHNQESVSSNLTTVTSGTECIALLPSPDAPNRHSLLDIARATIYT